MAHVSHAHNDHIPMMAAARQQPNEMQYLNNFRGRTLDLCSSAEAMV